jgi:hypothetical protein
MAYVILILASILLFAGFLALTRYEAARGVRFFAPTRDRFDREAERLAFIAMHVDLAAFIEAEARRLSARLGHDIAHGVLQAVRFVERLLTRLVRRLRIHHAPKPIVARETTREFVKQLSSFKGELSATRPEDLDKPPV